jgi:PilZ domain
MVGKSPVTTNSNVARHPSDDREEYESASPALAGKMFVPAEDMALDCQIIILSAEGARIQCEAPAPPNTRVVLYIDGFGRFEGVTTRYIRNELGLRFVCPEERRQKLLHDIAAFINGQATCATELRRHVRTPSISFGYFVPPSGESVSCEVLDISSQGMSLRTKGRPPIGEVVNFGCTKGRVVRHHKNGIAIQFLGMEKLAEDDGHGG